MANEFKLPFLGQIPLDHRLTQACDEGVDFFEEYSDSATASAFVQLVKGFFFYFDPNQLYWHFIISIQCNYRNQSSNQGVTYNDLGVHPKKCISYLKVSKTDVSAPLKKFLYCVLIQYICLHYVHQIGLWQKKILFSFKLYFYYVCIFCKNCL